MRIIVTGSSGRLGGFVVGELLRAGHEVVPVDLVPRGDDSPPTRLVNLRSPTEVDGLVGGVRPEVIVHLGNFPGFRASGAGEGFANNVSSTYNVFDAAVRNRVGRVVYASSIQVYGVFGEHHAAPAYLPIDEEHPHLTRDAYSLSKSVGEAIAESMVRREPALSVFSLRYTAIRLPQAVWSRSASASSIVWSLATYVRVEDAARATFLCCGVDRPGHTPLNIVAPRSARPWTSDEVAQCHGGMPSLRRALSAEDAMITSDRAREVLGFVADLPAPAAAGPAGAV